MNENGIDVYGTRYLVALETRFRSLANAGIHCKPTNDRSLARHNVFESLNGGGRIPAWHQNTDGLHKNAVKICGRLTGVTYPHQGNPWTGLPILLPFLTAGLRHATCKYR